MIRVGAFLLFLMPNLLVATVAPTPTPTPPSRLTGGFGRTPSAVSAERPQSMADVVRAAGKARARNPGSSVAITNKTLVTDPRKGKLTTYSPKPTPIFAKPASAQTSKAAAADETSPTGVLPDAPGGEVEWRDKARAARQRLEDANLRVAALTAETSKLENDFYSWDDGQYRDGVIKPKWDKKREELETARRDRSDAERELAELPEKARKAGALPGWIRE